jgi:hypothetical protein
MSIIIRRKKRDRVLRALNFLFSIINIIAAIGGASILLIYYYRAPEATLPVWRLGQVLMFYGIANIGLLIGIVVLIRMSFSGEDV